METGKSNWLLHFTGMLTLAFIVLKLCKVIAWSWFWVVSPLVILFVVALLILIGYYIWNRSKEKEA